MHGDDLTFAAARTKTHGKSLRRREPNRASTHFGKRFPAEVESFRRLCAIIDYILDLKYGRTADTNHLLNLIEAHFRQHVHVYGDNLIGPKWHRALHLPKQIADMKGLVLDTFCNERDHQIPKGFWRVLQRPPEPV